MGMLIHAHLEEMDKGVDNKKSAPKSEEIKVEAKDEVVEKTTKKRK
jgi:hypothetical protein